MATDVVGSKMKADNGYGQNGYSGASSDLPGQRTTSGFLPQGAVPTDPWQTRQVDTKNVPTTFGMKGAAPGPKIGPAPVRPAEPKL